MQGAGSGRGAHAPDEVWLVARSHQRHLVHVDPRALRSVRATPPGTPVTSTGGASVRLVGNASHERWL
ncbi:MAG TPA: hypothetical protein VMV53_11055 [Acidimicrobiales bacterium]|nr:hypothetical protein [Acidimicrobiales bacterium]